MFFENLPLHPAIVHLPLGILALVVPVTLLTALLRWQWRAGRQVFLVLAFIHLALMGSSYVALETGENEEDRVEKFVGHNNMEKHEERAETFMIGSIVAFAAALLLLAFGKGSFAKLAFAVLLTSQIILMVLGYRVGHSGGELVYLHGAAKAYLPVGLTDGSFPEETEKPRSKSDNSKQQ